MRLNALCVWDCVLILANVYLVAEQYLSILLLLKTLSCKDAMKRIENFILRQTFFMLLLLCLLIRPITSVALKSV